MKLTRKFAAGEVVWVLRSPSKTSAGTIERWTVTRVDQRGIVLSNGSRWCLDGRMRKPDRITPPSRVYHLDDPDASKLREKIKTTREKRHAAQLREEITRSLSQVSSGDDLRRLLSAVMAGTSARRHAAQLRDAIVKSLAHVSSVDVLRQILSTAMARTSYNDTTS